MASLKAKKDLLSLWSLRAGKEGSGGSLGCYLWRRWGKKWGFSALSHPLQGPVLGPPAAHPHSFEKGSSEKSVERRQKAFPHSCRVWTLLCRCRRGWQSNDTPCPSLLPSGHNAFFLPSTPWSSLPPSPGSEDSPMSQRPFSGVLMSLVISHPRLRVVIPGVMCFLTSALGTHSHP